MSEIKVYNKAIAGSIDKVDPTYQKPVTMAETRIGRDWKTAGQSDLYTRAFKSSAGLLGPSGTDYSKIAQYGGAMHVPRRWPDGSFESAYDRVTSGRFMKAVAAYTGNTLPPDWKELWDPLRMDITIRKNALPTVRQFFYNIYDRPDADRTNKLTEMLPPGIVFDIYNGTGQPVRQGDKGEGQTGTVDIKIYAAGFTWDLLASLFDKSMDMTMLSDAVAVGYNAKLDDLTVAPIFNYASYGNAGTAKHTAAATTSGAGRQELLYDTLENAVDGLGARTDPSTKNKIDPSGSYLLCSGNVARHAQRVIAGLPQNSNNKRLGAISEIAGIVAYDGDTIIGRDGNTTYSGVGDTYAYLVKPNRYMDIIVKRGLTTEIDMQPDVKTLAQEERAYYFAEGVYNAEGLENFVQKITLPAW